MRATGWCFTINNYTFEEMDACINLPMDYKVFGFEVGNKGTPHIQGYLYHHNKVSMRQIKKLLSRAHIEKAKGTPQDNYNYCTKDGEYYEFGDLPRKGKRTDMDTVVQMITNGHTYEEISTKYPKQTLYYSKHIKSLIEERRPRRVTKFYVMKAGINKHEDIQIIHEYFNILDKPAMVFDRLENIADYDDYNNVIFILRNIRMNIRCFR